MLFTDETQSASNLPLNEEAQQNARMLMGRMRAFIKVDVQIAAIAGRFVLLAVSGHLLPEDRSLTDAELIERAQQGVGHYLENQGLHVSYVMDHQLGPFVETDNGQHVFRLGENPAVYKAVPA